MSFKLLWLGVFRLKKNICKIPNHEPSPLENIANVLERLRIHGLRINAEKCHLARTLTVFLGLQISEHGNLPEPEKIKAIHEASPPRTKRQLQAFLGLCAWIREHVPLAAELLAPLAELLKGTKFSWTTCAQEAFDRAGQSFGNLQPLARPDHKLRFYLQTDASKIGAAAVLYQLGNGSERRIISYGSVKFNEAEQRWHSYEQEAFAVVWGIKRYRIYLETRPFTLKTDNRALLWLDKAKEEKSKYTRWSLLLQEFSYTVEHVPGKENVLTDSLSRNPSEQLSTGQENETERLLPPLPQVSAISIPPENTTWDVVKAAQEEDPDIQEIIIQLINLGKKTGDGAAQEKKTLKENQGINHLLYRVEDGRLKMLVPVAVVLDVLNHLHDHNLAGHPGITETLQTLSQDFFWPIRRKDTEDHVCRYYRYQVHKKGPRPIKAPLHHRIPILGS